MTCPKCGNDRCARLRPGAPPICSRRRHARGYKQRFTRKAFRHQRVDEAATEAKRASGEFQCIRSFVSRTGGEFLEGEDWKRRKSELFARCGGRCEVTIDHDCSGFAVHPHHVKERGEGGSDDLSNLLGTCGEGHRALHTTKQVQNPREGPR